MMYKEMIQKRKTSIVMWVLIVLALFAVLVTAQLFRPKAYGLVMDLAAIAILTVLAYIIIKSALTEYEYVLIDTDFMFVRHIGSREKLIFHINLDDIVLIAPLKDIAMTEYHDRIKDHINLCQSFTFSEPYAAVFQGKDGLAQFTFQPSKKLLERLYHSIPDKIKMS